MIDPDPKALDPTRPAPETARLADRWHLAIGAFGASTDLDAIASQGDTSLATSARRARRARSWRLCIGSCEFDAINFSDAVIAHEPGKPRLFQACARCQRLKNQLRDNYVTVARHASGIPRGIRRRGRLRADVLASFVWRAAAGARIRGPGGIACDHAAYVAGLHANAVQKEGATQRDGSPTHSTHRCPDCCLTAHAAPAVLPERVASATQPAAERPSEIRHCAVATQPPESFAANGANGARAPPSSHIS